MGSTEYGYDKRNNLTTIVNDIGGNVYSQNYRYHNTGVGNAAEDTKDNLPIQYWVLGTNTNYTYDSLNRLSCKTVDTTNDIVTNYRYSPATINDTTYFTHQLCAEDVNGTSYHYTYDAVGNITEIQKGTGVNSSSTIRGRFCD